MSLLSAHLPHRTAVLAALAAAVVAVPTAASAATPGPAVGPDQFFTGSLIDASSTGAAGSDVIRVDCPVASAAVTGHPAPGQFVEVNLAPTTTALVGFTGADATSIAADLVWSQEEPPFTVVEPIADLAAYATPAAIPTDILVPCSGTGAVSFAAQPGSSNSVSYTLHVTFVSPTA